MPTGKGAFAMVSPFTAKRRWSMATGLEARGEN